MPLPVKCLLTSCLLLAGLSPGASLAREKFEFWYPVDVIIFKPARTDLHEENWPEVSPVYPADMIAVNEPGMFRLSQLEQLGELPDTEAEVKPDATLPASDEFVFQSRGASSRNQEIIKTLTGANTEGDPIPTAEPEISDGIDTETAAIDAPQPAPVLIEEDPWSQGALAFSRSDDDSSLRSILRSLNRSSRFNVLSHHSWRQPINNDPTPILIQTGQRYDDRFEVEGTLSFSRSRYLHVQTDLWYTRFEPRDGGISQHLSGIESNLSDERLEAYRDLVEVEKNRGLYYPSRTHQMVQSRRMRSSELHYLDHPLFGVIVRVNRFTPDTDQPAS